MNEVFLSRMKEMLQDEYDAYRETLEQPAYRGLRVNTLKTSAEELNKELPFPLTATPFCKDAYYISQDIMSLGNHPYHLCGLFYLQEPSASSAVEILAVEKGDWVLDLCAAPGGKSSQIAAKLEHTGFLVSNEIEPSRAAVLLSNMERIGAGENMITNANPQVLCEEMQGHFDKVLVDAPCSGEGMFKKNTKAIEEWSIEHVASCKVRQLHILNSAYQALKQNGILVYSTCTYSCEENEQVIDEFLQAHPDMELLDCQVSFGRRGIPYRNLPISKVRRIFPMDKGEGHFIAKLKRNLPNPAAPLKYEKEKKLPDFTTAFLHDQLSMIPSHRILYNHQLYLKQTPFLILKKVRILRQGIACGELRKQRLEPHHQFYLNATLSSSLQHVVEVDKELVRLFYSGNVLPIAADVGYIAIAYHGHVLGYGKSDGTTIKNKLPKGIRCTIDKNLF